MSQRGRKQPTTSQNQGYNQHQNVPPQPYCPANPGMMPPVQQYMYIPVPVSQSGQPQMPAQYPGQPFMPVPYVTGQQQMPTQNPGLLPMPALYPPPLMSQRTFPPNVRQTQRSTSQGNLNILEQTTEKGKSGKKSRRKADNQNSSDGLLENPDKSHDLNEDVCSNSIDGRGRGRGKGRGRGDNHDRTMKQDRNDAENDSEDETMRQNNRGQGHQRGRGRNGGRGRGGHKEQVDRNVHQSEDDKSRHDNESSRDRGRYRGRGRGDRHQHDRKCHQRDQDDETEIAAVDDNEVFKFMIKKIGGGCYFEDFVKQCDLFPLNANIPRWFTKHNRRFHIYRDGQKIVYLSPFYRDARICIYYNNKRTKCDKTHCDYFHVCHRFVRGNCRQSDCSLSHSFKSADNRSLKEKLGISDFSDVDIKIMLNSYSPSVCYDYIYNKGCKVPDLQRCPYLHLCSLFIFKKCTEHCKFKLNHSIQQFHNKWVLTSFHMKDWPIERVLKSIYVPPRTETGDYSDNSDLSQDEEDSSVCGYDSDTYKYSDFIEAESTESLSGHRDDDHSKRFNKLFHSMEKLDTEDKGETEPSIERVKLSRMGRFKSTENIISGIVGKDDQGLVKMSVAEDLGAIPKQRQRTGSYHDDDDMDIKEKERLLMEKWEQEHGSSSTLDASERKQPLKSRQMKKSQCDSDYQERCPTLLLDEAENTNICIHVTKDKCHAKTCKNHHLKTGIPYLWQIKMPGKWCSFSTAENEKIEKDFTDLSDYVSTQMVYNQRQYSYYVYFTNPMYAVVYDVDGRADGEGYKYIVRRLSTPSFTKKKRSTDCYLTQWRWYFKDDTQKWVSYSKDVFQFTLEKKYITKQNTYLFTRDNFNFKYRIDFLNMKQTNLVTSKARQVLRRPLFVSRVDIEQKKYPEIIPFPAASSTTKPMHFYHWDCAHDFELVELNSTGKEYNDVLKSLSDSMDHGRFNVKDIYRIQNRKLWSEYDTKKKHMLAEAEQDGRGQNVDERDLFHGTDSLNTCHGICTNNFDFRTSGRNVTLYGKGSYFSVRSKLRDSYTKDDTPFEYKFMLRAKVLVGQFAKGNPFLHEPPEIQGQSHKLYDSCVDKVQDPQIFVIFDTEQCYPEYLFLFTDRDMVPTMILFGEGM